MIRGLVLPETPEGFAWRNARMMATVVLVLLDAGYGRCGIADWGISGSTQSRIRKAKLQGGWDEAFGRHKTRLGVVVPGKWCRGG